MFNVPVGWALQVDEAQGLVYLQEDPADAFSPDILMLSVFNEQGLSPELAIQQALANTGIINATVVEQQSLEGGLLVVVEGFLQSVFVKLALVSFTDLTTNTLSVAMFSSPAERFDELGGAALIFVTVGGQDPALYEASMPSASSASTEVDAWCFEQDSVVYGSDYCVYLRAMQARAAVPPELLAGQWTYALSVPTGDVWQSVDNGDLSFDASGTGMAIFFHADGQYDLIYTWSSTQNFCTNSVKAFESGQYQFDGLSLTLSNSVFKSELSTCGGTPGIYEDTVSAQTLELAFSSANELALVMSCEAHAYMISCNDLKTRYFVLQRGR